MTTKVSIFLAATQRARHDSMSTFFSSPVVSGTSFRVSSPDNAPCPLSEAQKLAPNRLPYPASFNFHH